MTPPRALLTTEPWPVDAAGGLLRLLVGPPAAGKTTWCRDELAAGRLGTRLSPDDTRGELGHGPHDQSVTAAAVEQVRHQAGALLADRAEVTIDATSTTPAERRTWLDLARAHDVPAIAVIVWEPLDIVLARNSRRAVPVPRDVVFTYWHRITGLTVNSLLAEGFRAVAELVSATCGEYPATRSES